VRLTGAICGWVFRFDGEQIHIASAYGVNQRARGRTQGVPDASGHGFGDGARGARRHVVNIGDVTTDTDAGYTTRTSPCSRATVPFSACRCDARARSSARSR
jgi:hypothetical protein